MDTRVERIQIERFQGVPARHRLRASNRERMVSPSTHRLSPPPLAGPANRELPVDDVWNAIAPVAHGDQVSQRPGPCLPSGVTLVELIEPSLETVAR